MTDSILPDDVERRLAEVVDGPEEERRAGVDALVAEHPELARLALFRQVCAAVRYAHHKGLIHRDLEPAKVLVTDESGAAQVKIIDFGLARIADQSGAG